MNAFPYKSVSLSLSLSLSLLLISGALTLNAQTLRTPNGAVGNSGNGNVGVGVTTTPTAKLDVATDENTGGFQVNTTVGGNGLISNPPGVGISPYALQVIHTSYNQVTSTFSTSTTMRMLPNGQLYLGATNTYGYTSASFLNLPNQGLAVYNNQNDYLKLTYGIVPGQRGARINWTSNGQSGADKNLFISHNNTPIMQFYPDGLVQVENTLNAAKVEVQNTGTENEDLALNVRTGLGDVFRVSNTGSVYIGSNLNGSFFEDYSLYVEKGIRAERVRVDIAADNGWADFVFEEGYELMPIDQLRAYIQKYKHLPNVPSAEEVAEKGIDLAEMNAILLRQIEELTLRVIELEEKVFQTNNLSGAWMLDSVINTSLGSNSQIITNKSTASEQVTLRFYADGTCTTSKDKLVERGIYKVDENLIQMLDEQTKNIKVEYIYRQVSTTKLYVSFKGSRGVSRTTFVFTKIK